MLLHGCGNHFFQFHFYQAKFLITCTSMLKINNIENMLCNKVVFLNSCLVYEAELCRTIDYIYLMKYIISYLLKTMQVSGKKYIIFMTIYI